MAQALELATAYVSLSVSADGMRKDVNRQLGKVEGDLERTGKKGGRKFGGAIAKAAGAAAAAGGALATGTFLKGAISEASDLAESMNAVEVTFGEAADGIKRLGREAANGLGLSQTEFQGISVQFSAFAQSIAGDGGDVVSVMDDLTTRGSDFASVMNLDVSEAMGLFQSGLAGETEPLRKFGIDLSAAAVEAHAVEKGIAAAGSEMTEQEKVQARYSLLMEQTAKTQGDFANTSDSLANSQRRLGANWDNIKATLGAGLLPVMERLSNWVVDTALPAFESFIQQWRDGDGAAGAFKDTLTGVWDAVSGAFGYVRDTAVPAIKGFIDEFRNGEGAGGKFRDVLTGVWDAAQVAFGWIRDEGLPALKNLWRFIVDTLWPDIKEAFIDRIWPAMVEVGGVIKDFWEKDAQPALKGLWRFIKDTLAPFLVDFYENGVKPTFDLIGKAIVLAWEVGGDALNRLKNRVQEIRDAFTRAKDGIANAWSALGGAIARPINTVIDSVNSFLEKLRRGLNNIPGVEFTAAWGVIPNIPVPAARTSSGSTAGRTFGSGAAMLATGGPVLGYSPSATADNIPAWLTAGEYVLPVRAVQALKDRFGPGFLESLRRGMPGYARGGEVGGGVWDSVRSAVGSGWNWLSNIAKDARGWVRKLFGEIMPDFGGSWAGKAAKGAAGSVVSQLADWVKGKADAASAGQNPAPGSFMSWPYGWRSMFASGPDFHTGLDFRAPTGTPVKAAGSGRVLVGGGWNYLGGRYVEIAHPSGINSGYFHLSKALVSSGANVSAGQLIGRVGNTGAGSLGPHLHFQTGRGSVWNHFDPREFLVADGGATLAPGLNVLNNKTGGPEPLARTDQEMDLTDATIEKMRRAFVAGADAAQAASSHGRVMAAAGGVA